jgi:hypothetical protein
MTHRRQVRAVAATVVLGLAIALFVLAVTILRSAHEVYGPSGWRWWADQTSYLILGGAGAAGGGRRHPGLRGPSPLIGAPRRGGRRGRAVPPGPLTSLVERLE